MNDGRDGSARGGSPQRVLAYMNSQLLILLFTIAFGAVVLLIIGIESLLSVPQLRWFGQDNLIIIAPLVLIIGLPLFLSARRKYVLPPHREKRSVALLSVAALATGLIVP